MTRGQLAGDREVLGVGGHEVARPGHGLHDQAGDLVTTPAELLDEIVGLVEPPDDDLVGDARRQALAVQRPRLGAGVEVDALEAPGLGAVPAAGDLEDELATGERAGEHDRVHGRERAARREAQPLGVHARADELGGLHRELVGHPVLQTAPRGERLGEDLGHDGRRVAQQVREVPLPEVEQDVAVGVGQVRAAGVFDARRERPVEAHAVVAAVDHHLLRPPVDRRGPRVAPGIGRRECLDQPCVVILQGPSQACRSTTAATSAAPATERQEHRRSRRPLSKKAQIVRWQGVVWCL